MKRKGLPDNEKRSKSKKQETWNDRAWRGTERCWPRVQAGGLDSGQTVKGNVYCAKGLNLCSVFKRGTKYFIIVILAMVWEKD